jgi:Dehydrogenases with different specificities (related to short-chain alcohol dehydrogenases)
MGNSSDQNSPKAALENQLDQEPQYHAPNYRGANKLREKVALVTGGDSGIGRAIAVLFAREGADVAIVYLPAEQKDAEVTRQAVKAEGQEALLLAGDLTDPSFCREIVDRTVEQFGRLDIVVNNAGFQSQAKNIVELSDEQWERTFQTNIHSFFRVSKAALPHLKPGSSIINTGSTTGLDGNPDLLDYSATKGAIHSFTKSLAANLADKHIRVNCVVPGPVWTALNPADQDPEEIKNFGKDTPFKRPAQPEEIAPCYVFLASEADSSFISGELITITAGSTSTG